MAVHCSIHMLKRAGCFIFTYDANNLTKAITQQKWFLHTSRQIYFKGLPASSTYFSGRLLILITLEKMLVCKKADKFSINFTHDDVKVKCSIFMVVLDALPYSSGHSQYLPPTCSTSLVTQSTPLSTRKIICPFVCPLVVLVYCFLGSVCLFVVLVWPFVSPFVVLEVLSAGFFYE